MELNSKIALLISNYNTFDMLSLENIHFDKSIARQPQCKHYTMRMYVYCDEHKLNPIQTIDIQ